MESETARLLRKVPLLAAAGPAAIDTIARTCTVRQHAAGSEIVGYRDCGRDVYFILAGRATVRIYSSQGRVVDLRQIGPGDMFGEYAALDGVPRSASIEAERDVRTAVLTAEQFNRLVAEDADVSRALVRHLVGQLRSLTHRFVELSTLAVNRRIEAELLRVAHTQGCKLAHTPHAIRIDDPPTHQELASRVSTHREAISRHLSHLSRQGVIRRAGRSLVIEDMARLAAMVGAEAD